MIRVFKDTAETVLNILPVYQCVIVNETRFAVSEVCNTIEVTILNRIVDEWRIAHAIRAI